MTTKFVGIFAKNWLELG